MKVVGTGLVLSLLASIGIFSWLLHRVGIHPAAMFFAIFLLAWAFLIVGFIMLLAARPTVGAVLIAIGALAFLGAVPLTINALVFLPIALVTIVGAIMVARRNTAR
ncbi:MAG TPA: hypothetical protein VGG24_09370 [Paraburkholderia sp.]|jgi:hypothetical protein